MDDQVVGNVPARPSISISFMSSSYSAMLRIALLPVTGLVLEKASSSRWETSIHPSSYYLMCPTSKLLVTGLANVMHANF